eukprot:NODE_11284_length_1296_cov_10.101796.p1 GENE.NODE_11284_length_1296_cov_10.101796~~NODE_11284_length_1296_cov_10.101796.p1  ORF type:complete len:367 (-),score=99.27 NODE_11284_length_1296_cov_10.101796:196-1170(-)
MALSCFARLCTTFANAWLTIIANGYLVDLFGDDTSGPRGALATCVSGGLMVGSFVGGLLFYLFGGREGYGYVLPPIVCGAMELLLAGFNLFFFPPLASARVTSPVKAGIRQMTGMFSCALAVPLACALAAGLGYGMMLIFVPLWLTEAPLLLPEESANTAWFAMAAVFAVSAPLVGILDDKSHGHYADVLATFGLLLLGMSGVLLSDMLAPSVRVCGVAVSMASVSLTLIYVPSVRWLSGLVRNDDELVAHERTRGMVAATLFQVCNDIGIASGALFSGFVGIMLGMKAVPGIFAAMFMLFACVVGASATARHRHHHAKVAPAA